MRSDGVVDRRAVRRMSVAMFQSMFPILTVRDLPAALGFYRDLLGFRQTYQFPAEGRPAYVSLRLGDSALGLGQDTDAAERPGGTHRFELWVYADDCDQEAAVRAADGPARGGPVGTDRGTGRDRSWARQPSAPRRVRPRWSCAMKGNDDLVRWFYRGGHPNRVAAALNRFWAILSSAGLWPSRMVAVEVRGRRSGRLLSFPMVVADYRGDRYLVAMLGEGTNWVVNVRAAGGRAVLRHGRREAVRLEEVEPRARAPILRRYLQVAPGARPHVPVDRRAPLADFEGIADRYPVFRIRAG
jgi:catechol 2,3-dioxygenase-like lactoylglutathione lyase family enzyme